MRSQQHRPPALALIACLALAALGLLAVEPLLEHTDDGCAVEIHCLACRLLIASPSLPGAVAAPTPRLVCAYAPPLAELAALRLGHLAAPAPRGPPASSDTSL